jgi:hypothetical protein
LAGPTPEIVITDKILTLQNAETVCETTEKEVCEMVDSEEVCKMVSEEVCEDIPEKKDVQVNFTYGEKEGSITVNFDGFNRCRAEGKTKTKCLALLKDQIQKNIQWWKEGVDARAAEEQIGDFSSELKPTDF